jgi:hypothetical protein
MVYALTDVPGGRWSWEEIAQHNIGNFCGQGVRLYQADIFLEQLWKENGTFDITPAQRQIAGILNVCPAAGVIFRFHVTAPKWWMRSHSGEWVRYADVGYEEEDPNGLPRIIEDDNYPVRRVSLASDLWRDEAAAKLKQFLLDLSSTPEGGAVAGIQVADGIYGEWHNWGFFRNEPDVGGPMERVFREWLGERYGNDASLRSAWSRRDISLATVRVPGMVERRTTAGVFRNPADERPAIDYYTCVHRRIAANILLFARTVKETWPRPIITGTFYGYYFSVFGRQAAGGHLDLHHVLSSPYLDYLSGPQAYEPDALRLGDPYRSRSLILSVRLHGKLWLDEMDNEPTIPILRDKNRELLLRNSIANVRRNVLFSATKGMGLWFYDFGVAGVDLDRWRYSHRGSRGTWDDPVVMKEIGAMRGLIREGLGTEYRSEADVLFVYDTESFYHTASLRGTDPVSSVLIDHVTLAAFRSGVVFDPVHVGDLERVDLSPYRVVVFGNTYVLNEKQRKFIRNRVARDGRTLVWFYAPGYSDGVRLRPEAIGELTGIRLAPVSISGPPVIEVHGLADSSLRYTGADSTVTPLFAVSDPLAEIFGVYAATDLGAVARRRDSEHTAWYIALPARETEPLRSILHRSGAHVYSRGGDIVYGGGGLLVVHTSSGGHHTVYLRNGISVSFDLPEGASTLVLDPRTGKSLLPTP